MEGMSYKLALRVVIVLLVALSLYFLLFTNSSPRSYIRDGATPSDESFHAAGTTESKGPRVAVCLVGGARRFELTGPSLVDRLVNVFNNSDLFVHSPFDKNSFKLSLLNGARRIAAVKIYEQKKLPETEELKQVLEGSVSPNGLQGLLHYYKLVEGCVEMIRDYQTQNRVQYDWIIRTRLDTYWSAPIQTNIFLPGKYVIPLGTDFSGLNDRFGAGDANTSWIALARFSVLHELYEAGYRKLGAEPSFKTQLQFKKVPYERVQLRFCVLSDRSFPYPPQGRGGSLVASISSETPLCGAYCRPCLPACMGECSSRTLQGIARDSSWIEGEPDLCDAHEPWDQNWELYFDSVAGEKYKNERKRIGSMDLDQCIADMNSMKQMAGSWNAPSPTEICRMGLANKEGP